MLVADPHAAAAYAESRQTLQGAPRDEQVTALAETSAAVRRDIVSMIDSAQLGHIGGDLSVTDILVTLFGAVLNVDPEHPDRPDRDRFVLSKGHCSAALYATLAQCGFFPRDELSKFMAPLSMLNGHPDRKKVPGVETNTGPLGHGFPVAVGCALAAKLRGASWRTFVVLGDGESQEGSNWEAAMTAPHYELASITAVVDRNRLQQGAGTEETKRLEPFAAKWESFGWEVREIDGHDYGALLDAFAPSTSGKPVAVIANTIKGKGISFIEDRVEWHHKVPTADQVQAALEELSR
jgi:transketolase